MAKGGRAGPGEKPLLVLCALLQRGFVHTLTVLTVIFCPPTPPKKKCQLPVGLNSISQGFLQYTEFTSKLLLKRENQSFGAEIS